MRNILLVGMPLTLSLTLISNPNPTPTPNLNPNQVGMPLTSSVPAVAQMCRAIAGTECGS